MLRPGVRNAYLCERGRHPGSGPKTRSPLHFRSQYQAPQATRLRWREWAARLRRGHLNASPRRSVWAVVVRRHKDRVRLPDYALQPSRQGAHPALYLSSCSDREHLPAVFTILPSYIIKKYLGMTITLQRTQSRKMV